MCAAEGMAVRPTPWRLQSMRVRAYNMNGDVVCWNGCQDSIDPWTLPAHIDISTLLGIEDWVKYTGTADGEGRRWQPLGWQPKAVLHSNGAVAMPNEQLGTYGTTVTVLPSSPGPLACSAALPQPDLAGVDTPPTPPMRE